MEESKCVLCNKIEGGDLGDYFVFDAPLAHMTFAPVQYVVGPLKLPAFEGAKGATIHAHYGCCGNSKN